VIITIEIHPYLMPELVGTPRTKGDRLAEASPLARARRRSAIEQNLTALGIEQGRQDKLPDLAQSRLTLILVAKSTKWRKSIFTITFTTVKLTWKTLIVPGHES
jgi:hypothetical protein